MIARYAGASLGLLAFFIVCASGLYTGNPVALTLSRGILALFLFYVLGLVLGYAAQLVVAEHERALMDGARNRLAPGEQARIIDADGDGALAKDRGAVHTG